MCARVVSRVKTKHVFETSENVAPKVRNIICELLINPMNKLVIFINKIIRIKFSFIPDPSKRITGKAL